MVNNRFGKIIVEFHLKQHTILPYKFDTVIAHFTDRLFCVVGMLVFLDQKVHIFTEIYGYDIL